MEVEFSRFDDGFLLLMHDLVKLGIYLWIFSLAKDRNACAAAWEVVYKEVVPVSV
jgi:hypothetical protein